MEAPQLATESPSGRRGSHAAKLTKLSPGKTATSTLLLIFALATYGITAEAALSTGVPSMRSIKGASFMSAEQKSKWIHRSHLNGSQSQFPQLAPYYSSKTSTLQVGTEECSTGAKTGYWIVGCYADKGPDPNRLFYDQFVPKEDRNQMTPLVCFNFCKIQYGMRFFFLGEPGNAGDGRGSGEAAVETATIGLCSCGRFYHKSSGKGSLAQCDRQCPGDTSINCGGHHKESIYQMHDCRAAEAPPTNPWESRGLRVELAGKDGVKFWSGADETPGVGSPEMSTIKDHPNRLLMVVLDPHDGFLKSAQNFNLEGELDDGTRDVNLATSEAARVEEWMAQNTITNDIIMIAFQSRVSVRDVMWGASVEKALRLAGCPMVQKPQANFGYGAICGGQSSAPQSPSQPYGHVSGYLFQAGSIEQDILYAIDCEVSAWEDSDDCSISCGGGQQYQQREVTVEPANGGKLCPPDYQQYVPCNVHMCPIDCVYSQWSGWGECDPSCGPGDQVSTRSISVAAQYGGRECTQNPHLEKHQFCEVVPCPIDCVFGDWRAWTACNSFCGTGEQERTRGRSVLPQWGGLDCQGAFSETQSCIVRPCPVDCEVGEWHLEDGAECTTSCNEGVIREVRPVLTATAHGGNECPDVERDVFCFVIPCPIDCELSEWTSTSCDSSCGGGRLTRTREITTQPQFGGLRCPRSLELVEWCNTEPCPVDCVWASWGNWRRCSTTCGNGEQVHERYEEIEMQAGGTTCTGPHRETKPCEVVPCPINCDWGDWKDWGDCNMPCGQGRNDRTRTIATHSQYGGDPCEGPDLEEGTCEIKKCPVSCEVSDWRDVGECSKRCGGGKMFQIREVLTAAAHGGDSCPPVEQHVECNNHMCPIDCDMTAWSDNGPCSLSCGGGKVDQLRTVSVQPQYGGFACPGTRDRQMPCNTQPCPVDGVWGQWTGWGGCSAWCGDGTQSRTRNKVVIALHGGAPAAGVDQEIQPCLDRMCPIDCVWDSWENWGACNAACGPGEKQRSRVRGVVAQYGGRVCEGAEMEAASCEDTPCAIACEVSAWQEDGDCSLSCGGGQLRLFREISVAAMFGGSGCPTDMERSVPCNIDPCPVDCELSDWVDASECDVSCGGGVLTEIKTAVTAPAHGGVLCGVYTSREVECNSAACPINCEWDAWGPWTYCSTTCGAGKTDRSREKYQDAMHGGVACTGPESQDRDCQVSSCPIHCEFSEWTEWSLCDEECGEGKNERSRYETVKEMHGGEMCVGPTFEPQSCTIKECSVDCKVSEWQEQSGCNQACGGGSRREVRLIEIDANHGGAECPSDLTRDLPCNMDPCAIDCVLAGWTNDGGCTTTCGGGVQRQARNIQTQPAYGGAACHPERLRYISCGEDICPVDCAWSQWGGWSPCQTKDTRGCGTGQRKRARVVLIASAGDGAQCEGPFEEQLACTLQPCAIDGVWSQWEDWAPCDQDCGYGWKLRQRILAVVPISGGLPAPGPREETLRCKDKECPIDCKVTAWKEQGECSHTCGDMARITEKRTISTSGAHGGAECPADLERLVPCNAIPCPIDCVLSDWFDAGECTSSCGAGSVYGKRNIDNPAAHNGKVCDAPLMRFSACNTQPCPVDCVYGSWSGWGTCSESCGDGKRERSREVEVEKNHGGLECLGEDEEEADCEIVPCARDGEWDSWQEWTNCNSDCGSGERTRARAPKVEAAYGGMPCEGDTKEVEDCESDPCPVDCEVSDWRTTGDCSLSCGGGEKEQRRTVEVPMQNDGAPCPGDLIRDAPCNIHPCPIDCEVSVWEDKTDCTVTCGGGTSIQIRNRLVRPRHDGVECPGVWMQTVECSTAPCPIHCEFGEWNGWSVCSSSCGGGDTSRSRAIAVHAQHGGAACEGELSEALMCNAVDCPVDGIWDEWTAWDSCSEICGPGFQSRARAPFVETAHGGYPLIGPASETRDCEDQPCGVDCIMSEWEDSVACDKSCAGGRKQEQRFISTNVQHGGVLCPTNLARWVPCNEQPCPVDCVSTEFAAGACDISCGGGSLTRSRVINTAPAHGGVACPAYISLPGETCMAETGVHAIPLTTVCSCNTQDCPVDCSLEEWAPWGDCSTTCGDGTSERARAVSVQPAHGGKVCPSAQDEYEQTTKCFIAHCPIDGVWDEWKAWGTCSQACGDGQQQRERRVKTSAQHGGRSVEGDAIDVRSCIIKECPVDCEVGSWKDDGDCSLTCGGGAKTQLRAITTDAAHGGDDCPPTEQVVACNDEPCPVDCVLTEWTQNGGCSHTCGSGQQKFVRSIDIQPAHGGVACNSTREKEEACNTEACPVDCVMSAWGGWGDCSASCADGIAERQRSVLTPAAHGGVACPQADAKVHDVESLSCKEAECPIHCAVSQWSDWSDCSVTCDTGAGGVQHRTRTITTPDTHGGQSCPDLADDPQTCSPASCPVHCEVSDWRLTDAGCSKTCGDGSEEMVRDVITAPAHGGSNCGDQTKSIPCFESNCPVNCEVSEWMLDGGCSANCGGGQQVERRILLLSDAYGGKPCLPEWERSVECNTQLCANDPMAEVGVARLAGAGGASISLSMNFKMPAVILGPISSPLTSTQSEGGDSPFSSYVSAGIVSLAQVATTEEAEGPASFELRNANGDGCLTYNLETTLLDVLPCSGETSQSWYLEGSEIKTSHDNKCLTALPAPSATTAVPAKTTPLPPGLARQPTPPPSAWDLIGLSMQECNPDLKPASAQSWQMGAGATKSGEFRRVSNVISSGEEACLKHYVDEGEAILEACGESNDFSWYDSTMAPFFSKTADYAMGQPVESVFQVETLTDRCSAITGASVIDTAEGCESAATKLGRPFVGKDHPNPSHNPLQSPPGCAMDSAYGVRFNPDLASAADGASNNLFEICQGPPQQTFSNIEDCRRECFIHEGCCGFVQLPDAGCTLKFDHGATCAPMYQQTGATSYLKSVSVSSQYQQVANLFPDVSNGAVALGSETGKIDDCQSECFTDAACCGFGVTGSASTGGQRCQQFTNCEPLKPKFGATFHEKASGEGALSWQVNIAGQGVQSDETADVPYLACESGVYKTVDGKMLQCGVVELRNTGDEWTEVSFHVAYDAAPVVITNVMTRDGGVALRSRQKKPDAGSFQVSLESMGGQGVADLSHSTWEKVAWLAIESGQANIGGHKADAIHSGNEVDMENGDLDFKSDFFTSPPVILASAMTSHEAKIHGLRVQFVDEHKIQLRLEPGPEVSSLMKEEIGLLAVWTGQMGSEILMGSLVSNDVDLAADPALEKEFDLAIDGIIKAPCSSSNLAGPTADPRFCLKTCATQKKSCAGVVVLPDGMCWLKKKSSEAGCGWFDEEEDFPGAQSYKIKNFEPPSPATCSCNTPNQGAAGFNGYTCSDGSMGFCGATESCNADAEGFEKGEWSKGCKVACRCSTPGTGPPGNQYTCTDGSSGYCGQAEVCANRRWFLHGVWDDACKAMPTTTTTTTTTKEATWSMMEGTGEDWKVEQCKSGETVIGGGCDARNSPYKFQTSRPSGGGLGWECGGHGGGKFVSAVCSSSMTTTIKSVQGGDWVTVQCDAGQKVIGGGCNAMNSPHKFQASHPVDDNKWRCGGHGGNKQVYAICSSSYTPTIKKADGDDWTSVQCDAGKKLISGGCDATTDPHIFQASTTDGQGWKCGGHGSKKSVWAICAE